MKFLKSWSRRIIVLVGVFVLLLLVMDLNSRMVHMLQLRGERDAEIARVNGLLVDEAELDTKIAYAQSDEIVAEWARNQNFMQQEGDFVVVILPSGDPAPEQISEVEQETPDLSNWEAWKLWLSFQE
jgi:hypothetical protein